MFCRAHLSFKKCMSLTSVLSASSAACTVCVQTPRNYAPVYRPPDSVYHTGYEGSNSCGPIALRGSASSYCALRLDRLISLGLSMLEE